MRRGGFTLIELLIVVAIIAILAAIAVPNFLEAQTRAKVSRARADMRSLATAIEAYVVDYNYYPTYHYTSYMYGGQAIIEFFIGGHANSVSSPWTESNPFPGPYQLTTPVAYITSRLTDPFHLVEDGDPWDTPDFLYVNWRHAFESQNTTFFMSSFVYDNLIPRYGIWRLISAGPDRSRVAGFGIEYDATNGTISLGDIYRTQKSPEGHTPPV